MKKKLVVPHQVHACEILMIDEAYLSLSEAERSRCREGVDAVITSEKNCCICVSTADCVPDLSRCRETLFSYFSTSDT